MKRTNWWKASMLGISPRNVSIIWTNWETLRVFSSNADAWEWHREFLDAGMADIIDNQKYPVSWNPPRKVFCKSFFKHVSFTSLPFLVYVDTDIFRLEWRDWIELKNWKKTCLPKKKSVRNLYRISFIQKYLDLINRNCLIGQWLTRCFTFKIGAFRKGNLWLLCHGCPLFCLTSISITLGRVGLIWVQKLC